MSKCEHAGSLRTRSEMWGCHHWAVMSSTTPHNVGLQLHPDEANAPVCRYLQKPKPARCSRHCAGGPASLQPHLQARLLFPRTWAKSPCSHSPPGPTSLCSKQQANHGEFITVSYRQSFPRLDHRASTRPLSTRCVGTEDRILPQTREGLGR